jgi:anti-sigma factor RsiW
MAPDRYAPLVSVALDGELGWFRRWRMARHLKSCPSCAAKLERLQAMQLAIRTTYRAPPGLAQRIGNILPRDDVVPRADVMPTARPRWGLAPLAGTALAGALAGAALTLLVVGGPVRQVNADLTEAVLDSHIQSLVTDHLTDVLTSDQHTVKPWLSARLDVSPPALDLGTEGFELIGGRVAYFGGHRRAAVVYRRGQHVIDLFAWGAPGASDAKFRPETRQGYNLIFWRQDGIEYAAVSDVEMDQLAKFSGLVAGAGCTGPLPQIVAEGGSGPVPQKAAEDGSSLLPQKAAEGGGSLLPQKAAEGGSSLLPQTAAEGGSSLLPQKAAASSSGPVPQKAREDDRVPLSRNAGSLPCKE